MVQHRIRLDDSEIALICAALRSRCAGSSAQTQRYIRRLVIRLEEQARGNPDWVLSGVPGYADKTSN